MANTQTCSADLNRRITRLRKRIRQAKSTRIKLSQFQYKPFSVKQLKVLTWWMDESPVKGMDGVIADGAIRSGKTLCMSLSFGLWAMSRFSDQNFLICGKTIGSLRHNVVFDFKRQMQAHGYKIHDLRSDNLLMITKGGVTNRFHLFGGKDERSQDLVQGITAAGVLFDEVALMPESFVNQATGRCSVEGSRFWFNCNPEGPFHWFKVNWIDRIRGMDPDAEFNKDNPEKKLLYLHFTMEDNLSLSDDIKARYRAMYRGIFFHRYIEGLWYIASGLIYDMFDKARNTFTGKAPEACKRYIAVDAGTTNPTVFLGIADDNTRVWQEKEYYWDSRAEGRQKSDTEYADDFDKFVEEWGYKPRRVIVDPAAANLRLVLKRRGYKVIEANNEVYEGISRVAVMFAMGLLLICQDCTHTLKELFSYSWDSKAAENGMEKPIKQMDHAMDALRYFVMTIVRERRVTKAKGVRPDNGQEKTE